MKNGYRVAWYRLTGNANPIYALKKVWEAGYGTSMGMKYIDYQAGFSAFFLGHNDPDVNRAVADALESGHDTYGCGGLQIRKANSLNCSAGVFQRLTRYKLQQPAPRPPTMPSVSHARATGKDHLIIIQGGLQWMAQ